MFSTERRVRTTAPAVVREFIKRNRRELRRERRSLVVGEDLVSFEIGDTITLRRYKP